MRRIFGVMLIMLLVISSVSSTAYASVVVSNEREPSGIDYNKQKAENRKILYGIEHASIPNAANEFINSKIDEMLESLVADPEFYDASDRDLNDLLLLAPFQIYVNDGGDLTCIEGFYHFPVYSNERIVCLISVFCVEEIWHYQVSNMLVEELTGILTDNKDRKVVQAESEDAETPFSFANELTDQIHDASENIYLDLSGKYCAESERDGQNNEREQTRDDQIVAYLSSFITTSIPTQGFSINQNYYKRLDMSFCLVNQGSYNCGLACICTLYRYRTARHDLNCAIATDINNVLAGGAYSFGTTVGQVGFINYLMPVAAANQYEIHHDYEGLITHTEVLNNINNQFPIIYGGYRIVSGDLHWHAFVLQGYQISNNKMKFYYFNPHGYDLSTDYVSAGTPHVMAYGSYSYTEGGNACLIKP